MLEAYGITRLISSTSTRCLSTLLPYAHHREFSIESYSQLTEEEGAHDAKGVAKLVSRIRTAALADNQPTAICVHRPVLPHILDSVGDRPGHPGHWRVPGRPPDRRGRSPRPGATPSAGLSGHAHSSSRLFIAYPRFAP